MSNAIAVEEKLAETLLNSQIPKEIGDEEILEACKNQAKIYVEVDGNITVLSDFRNNNSYLYVGKFGNLFGLATGHSTIDSAFEEAIFNKIYPDDLLERHILELSYLQFVKTLPIPERNAYSTHSLLRINVDGQKEPIIISHRTIYLRYFSNGDVWLALCIYSPATSNHPISGIDPKIINQESGEMIRFKNYQDVGDKLLSKREVEVVKHIASGMNSDQIAQTLHLSVYTVRRHRQNILKKLNASNTSEAVKICALMEII